MSWGKKSWKIKSWDMEEKCHWILVACVALAILISVFSLKTLF